MSSVYTFKMPENACNSHLHVIDMKYSHNPKSTIKEGTLQNYKSVAKKIQMPRAVFVQAKLYALDSTCLLDAIEEFGLDKSRGIAVLDRYVSDQELEYLHEHGIRGLRFSLWDPPASVVRFEDVKPLSEKIKHLGWNIQLHMQISQMIEQADVLESLDCRLVLDHMARLDPKMGVHDPNYDFIRKLIDKGNTWIKLCGPYLNTVKGYPWTDAAETARAIAAYAPERVLYGTDYPNTLLDKNPDPIALVEMLSNWIPDERNRRLALVDNPDEVYFY